MSSITYSFWKRTKKIQMAEDRWYILQWFQILSNIVAREYYISWMYVKSSRITTYSYTLCKRFRTHRPINKVVVEFLNVSNPFYVFLQTNDAEAFSKYLSNYSSSSAFWEISEWTAIKQRWSDRFPFQKVFYIGDNWNCQFCQFPE